MVVESDLASTLYEPLETNKIGFNTFSEKVNGRAAMVGFFVLFCLEVFTKQKLFTFLI